MSKKHEKREPSCTASGNVNWRSHYRQLYGCCSVPQSCPTLCDPMDCIAPGFPVLHHLQSLFKFTSIESMMLSNHLILSGPLLLRSIFPNIRVFFNAHQMAKEGWAPKNWCFWIMVLEKTLQSPLDSKEIKAVHPKRNQPWILIGKTDAEA